MTARLEARGLVVARGPAVVLRGVDLALGRGEALALVGPNAAGKSTLVRALAGLLPVRQGEVRLDGAPLGSLPRGTLARRIALVAPDDGAPSPLTVGERVALGRYPHRGPLRPFGAEDEAAVRRALDQAGMADLADRRLSTLSAGERQRASLARGLAQDPDVLLLDEPSAHLDVGHQLQLFRVLDAVRSAGMAVLAVVHDLQQAAAWADRMALLDRGRIMAMGPAAEVLASDVAAEAFGVTIRGHAVPGLHHPLYAFTEP